jgi:hypothetical protein
MAKQEPKAESRRSLSWFEGLLDLRGACNVGERSNQDLRAAVQIVNRNPAASRRLTSFPLGWRENGSSSQYPCTFSEAPVRWLKSATTSSK